MLGTEILIDYNLGCVCIYIEGIEIHNVCTCVYIYIYLLHLYMKNNIYIYMEREVLINILAGIICYPPGLSLCSCCSSAAGHVLASLVSAQVLLLDIVPSSALLVEA